MARARGISGSSLSTVGTTSASDRSIRPAGHLWSPDGALVATGRQVGGKNVLAIIDAASGDVLPDGPTLDQAFPGGVHYPSWQRLAVAP